MRYPVRAEERFVPGHDKGRTDHACSRGFLVGFAKPGTNVQVLDAGLEKARFDPMSLRDQLQLPSVGDVDVTREVRREKRLGYRRRQIGATQLNGVEGLRGNRGVCRKAARLPVLETV